MTELDDRQEQTGFADNVYYDVAMQRLAQQLGQIDAVDRKLATTFGFSNAILAVFASIVAIHGADLEPLTYTLLGLGTAAYLLAMCCALRGYAIGAWSLRPDLATLQSHCERHDDTAMRFWVADECARSLRANEPRMNPKVRLAKIATWLIPAEAVLLAAAALSSIA
jgi:hypothetical protein